MLSFTKCQFDILAGQQHNWCQLLACFISKSIKMTMVRKNCIVLTTKKLMLYRYSISPLKPSIQCTVLPRNNLSKTASKTRLFCVHFASETRASCVRLASSLRPNCGHFASIVRAPCVHCAGTVRPPCGHFASALRLRANRHSRRRTSS